MVVLFHEGRDQIIREVLSDVDAQRDAEQVRKRDPHKRGSNCAGLSLWTEEIFATTEAVPKNAPWQSEVTVRPVISERA